MMILCMILSVMLPIILISVNSLINKKNTLTREKMSAFECGFDIMNSARIPFSMRFYLIAVIFLIFDIEISLILPMPFIFNMNNPSIWIILSIMFMIILILGLFHEWRLGALNWSK